jgi:acyl carrier protein
MEQTEFYDRVGEFIGQLSAETTGEALTTAVKEDDNLFDLGLVNSFTIIRMIVFVEELTGAQIDLADHDLETFYTLRGLYTVASGAGAA